MAEREMANPRVLLIVALVAGAIFTAIAIFVAVGYQPDSGSRGTPRTSVTQTSPTPR